MTDQYTVYVVDLNVPTTTHADTTFLNGEDIAKVTKRQSSKGVKACQAPDFLIQNADFFNKDLGEINLANFFHLLLKLKSQLEFTYGTVNVDKLIDGGDFDASKGSRLGYIYQAMRAYRKCIFKYFKSMIRGQNNEEFSV